MATIDLDMDDMFDANGSGGDIGATQGDMPDLNNDLDDLAGHDDGDLADDALTNLKKIKGEGARKKARAQPKLDGTRLTGKRGIPILPEIYKDIKFKGKGHEASDLQKVMKTMEHWAHRLFPKMTFDEVIQRCEKLGAKKDVQTIVKKMRLDMPIMDEDFVTQNDDDSINGDANGDIVFDKDPMDEADEDIFDEIMRDQENNAPQTSQTPTTNTSKHSQATTNTLHTSQTPSTSNASTTQSNTTSQSSGLLSEEQMERMERNKRLAMERRAAKLGTTLGSVNSPLASTKSKPSSSPNTSQPAGSPADETNKPDNKDNNDLQTEAELLSVLDGDSDNETMDTVETAAVNNNTTETGTDKPPLENSSKDSETTQTVTGDVADNVVAMETSDSTETNCS